MPVANEITKNDYDPRTINLELPIFHTFEPSSGTGSSSWLKTSNDNLFERFSLLNITQENIYPIESKTRDQAKRETWKLEKDLNG